MTAKQTATSLLVFFVGGILAFFTLRESHANTPPETGPVDARAEDAASKVIAYYFHLTVRCQTCRTIEAYSKEAIHGRFAEELREGKLEWRPVNVQLPENQHYVENYKLFTMSLVLVRLQNGEQKEFKILQRTWELVGEKAAFEQYVEEEVQQYLQRLR